MPEHAISQLGNRYHDFVRTHPGAAEHFTETIEDLLDDAGVVYDRVATRVKGWPSLKAKAKKKKADGSLVYPSPWDDIHDVIGVRITVFHSTVIPQVSRALGNSFQLLREVDKAAEIRISGGFGYGSHHLVMQVDSHPAPGIEELSQYAGMRFEVQIRTVLQHAWAEFEHDIRYKQGPNPPTAQVDRLFTLAAGLIELADQQFDDIASLMESDTETSSSVEITASTLPGILAMLLGNKFPPSRSDHYRFLEELLEAHELDNLDSLKQLLDSSAIAFLIETLRYKLQPGQIRLVDDLLLLKFGQQHIVKTGHLGNRTDRKKRLQRRLRILETGTQS